MGRRNSRTLGTDVASATEPSRGFSRETQTTGNVTEILRYARDDNIRSPETHDARPKPGVVILVKPRRLS